MLRRVVVETGTVEGLPVADPRITSFKGLPFFNLNDPPNLRELIEKNVMNFPFYKKSDSEVRYIKLPVAPKSIGLYVS